MTVINDYAGEPAGDFTALLRQHGAALRAACLRLTNGNVADADDLFQMTSVKAYRALSSLEDAGRFLPWCRSIATNTWTDICRRSHPTVPIHGVEVRDRHDFVDEFVDMMVLREVWGEFLDSLGERKREVIQARADGASSKEVAARFNMAPGAIDTIVSRTRARGRELLAGLVDKGALGIGTVVPRRVRAWWRRQLVRIGAMGRRADAFGSAQLSAAIAVVGLAAVAVTAAGTVAATSIDGGRSSPHGQAVVRNETPDDRVTAASALRLHGAATSGKGAPLPTDLVTRSAGCAFVLQCADGPGGRFQPTFGDGRNQGDSVISVWIPAFGWYWIDTTPHPAQVPPSSHELQLLFLGRPDALACDFALVADGRTCDGRDLVGLLAFVAEANREGAVGDECDVNDRHGAHVPVVCDRIRGGSPPNPPGPDRRPQERKH